jgi:hypothetical protein
MAFEVQKARRSSVIPQILIIGASNSGKTYSALTLACSIGKHPGLVDTENKKSSYYADKFDFSVVYLKPPFTGDRYKGAVEALLDQGCDVIVIDQITYEWGGSGGILNQVNDNPASNDFAKWNEPSRRHADFIDYINFIKVPSIICCRAKEQYEIQTNEKGKKVPVKIGLGPIQRGRNAGEGIEYEFPICFLLDEEHHAKVTADKGGIFGKTVEDEDGKLRVVAEPFIITEDTGRKIMNWARGVAKGKEVRKR